MLEYLHGAFPENEAVPPFIRNFLESAKQIDKNGNEIYNYIVITKVLNTSNIKVIFNSDIIISNSFNESVKRYFYKNIARRIKNSERAIEIALQELIKLLGEEFYQALKNQYFFYNLDLREWQMRIGVEFSIYLRQVARGEKDSTIFGRISFSPQLD